MTLISPAELARHYLDADWVVLDCRYDLLEPTAGRTAWAASHIPLARYADLDQDLAQAPGAGTGRHPLPDIEQLAGCLSRWGIGPDTRVVAYDDAGASIAGRLWWLLRWAGLEQVAVLDGGWSAWLAAGLATDQREAASAASVPIDLTPGEMPVCETEDLETGLRKGSLALLDVRTAERFAGAAEPIDPIAGHIPGAVNLPLVDNLDASGAFLPAAELARRFRQALAGRSPENTVVMCGSGVSACQTLLAMEHAGLGGAALYTGSWSGWISDPGRPVGRL
ncbi:MAG: sulfurtransferase [Gammaproteobacteria bacterium]